MKKNYLSILYLGLAINISAQETLWQRDIKSSTQDILTEVTLTLDRQILLSGSSINQESDDSKNGYDYHLVKLSQDGNALWEKYFGGTKNDYLNSVVSTNDGGFVLAGTSSSNRSNDKKDNKIGGFDAWIIRIDENGEELWQRTIGTRNNDESSIVVQSKDGDFFLAGNINPHQQIFGSKDVFVSKIDANGTIKQTNILGGNAVDEVTQMIPSPDGGVVLLIYSNSEKSTELIHTENLPIFNNSTELINSSVVFTGKVEDSYGEGDYWIVKLDKDANVEWQKVYGGEKDDHLKTIAFTSGGYLIGGESISGSSGNKKEDAVDGKDIWLISLDQSGNELWQKSFSIGETDVLMSLNTIRTTDKHNQNFDKGYLLGGYTQIGENARKNDGKFWMLYLDKDGNEEWRKHVEGKSAKKEEHLVSAILQSDGTYILAGTSGDVTGEENWKVLKLADKNVSELMDVEDIMIYPNPSEDYCYVEIGFPLENNEEAEIFLHDMSGRKLQTLKTKNAVTKIDTKVLPAGVYVVTVKTLNKIVNSKLIKK